MKATTTKRPRLRTLLLATNLVLLVSVVLISSGYYIWRHQNTMREQLESTAQQLREELAKKGVALATNIAGASERAIAANNFFFLFETLRAAVASDKETMYGLIMDGDRKVIASTQPKWAGVTLEDEQSRRIAASRDVGHHAVEIDGTAGLETAAPITTKGHLWGYVRLGLSLEGIDARLASARESLRIRMYWQFVGACAAAALLALLGAALNVWTAKWLTSPLEPLMQGVRRVADGDFRSPVEASGAEEFELLASSFNAMAHAVRDREKKLQDAMERVEAALLAEESANRIKSEFMANMSHELRTPLNALINVPAVLLDDFDEVVAWECADCGRVFEEDEEETQSDQGHAVSDAITASPRESDGQELTESKETDQCPICGGVMHAQPQVLFKGSAAEHRLLNSDSLASGRHLLGVINDVLDFSKLEAGRMTLSLEVFDVSPMLKELESTVALLSNDKKQKFTLSVPSEDLRLRGDRVKVSQVLVNLLGNAVKFTPEGGEIALDVKKAIDREEGAVLRFSVSDTGERIPVEAQKLVFERFRQVDGGHTRTHGGTGLGLSIARGIVELHGGSIGVTSELGVGSTFYASFPIAGPVSDISAIRGTEAMKSFLLPEGNQIRVTVIEDDAIQLSLMGRILEAAGMKCELIHDASGCIDRLMNSPPDVILLDIMMPRVSGLTILRLLKENPSTAGVPVIVTTAHHSNRPIVRKLGGHWLSKPWTAKRLIKSVCDGVGVHCDESELEAALDDDSSTIRKVAFHDP